MRIPFQMKCRNRRPSSTSSFRMIVEARRFSSLSHCDQHTRVAGLPAATAWRCCDALRYGHLRHFTSCDLVYIEVGSVNLWSFAPPLSTVAFRLPCEHGDSSRLAQRRIWEPHPIASESTTIAEAGAASKAEGLSQYGRFHPATVVEYRDLDRLFLVVTRLGCHRDGNTRRACLNGVVDKFRNCACGSLVPGVPCRLNEFVERDDGTLVASSIVCLPFS